MRRLFALFFILITVASIYAPIHAQQMPGNFPPGVFDEAAAISGGTPLTQPIIASLSATQTPSTAAVNYSALAGDTAGGSSMFTASLSAAATPWLGGTIKGLEVNIGGLSAGGYIVGLNINGTLSAVNCNATSAAKNCTSAGTVNISQGDTVAIEFCPQGNALTDCNSGSVPTIAAGQIVFSFIFTAPTQSSILVGGAQGGPGATTIGFEGFGPGPAWNATEINTSTIAPVAGTIKTLQVNLSNNPGAGASYTFTVFKNGVATAIVAGDNSTTCAGASSTKCSDLIDSVSVAANDTISLQSCPSNTATCPAGSAPTSRIPHFSIQFTPTTAGQSILALANHTVPATSAGTRYAPVNGASSILTTEANEENLAPVLASTMTVSNLVVAESTAPTSTNTRAFTAFDSGANGALGAPLTTNLTATITSSSVLTIGGVASTPAAADGTHNFTSATAHYFDYHVVQTGTQATVTWIKASVAVTVP